MEKPLRNQQFMITRPAAIAAVSLLALALIPVSVVVVVRNVEGEAP